MNPEHQVVKNNKNQPEIGWFEIEYQMGVILARSRLEILKESAVKSNHGRLTDTLFEGKTESESAVTYLVIGVHYPRFRAAVNRYTGR